MIISVTLEKGLGGKFKVKCCYCELSEIFDSLVIAARKWTILGK